MRTGLMLGLAVLTGLLGGFAAAKYDLTDRVSQVATDARSLCTATRGNAAVTSEQLEERLAAIAADHRLEASEIQVTIEPVTTGSTGAAAQIMGSLSKLTKGKVRMQASEVTARARLRGKKWLWSVDRTIESSCMLRGPITRSTP